MEPPKRWKKLKLRESFSGSEAERPTACSDMHRNWPTLSSKRLKGKQAATTVKVAPATRSKHWRIEEEAPGVLGSHRIKLGGRAQELAPISSGQSSLPSHEPPGAHVAQRPPKGPRWARRCGEACRCAGGCWSSNCCGGTRSCSRGSTVHGERHYCWQCFGPERASLNNDRPVYDTGERADSNVTAPLMTKQQPMGGSANDFIVNVV